MNPRLRISFLCHEFPPIGGGAATALDALTSALTKRRHHIQIITIGTGKRTSKHADVFRRQVIRLAAGRKRIVTPSAVELFRSYLALRLSSLMYLKGFDPDVLVAYFAFPAGYAVLPLARSLKVPLVVSLRGSDVPGFSNQRWGVAKLMRIPLLRATWEGADLLVANGPFLVHLAEHFMAGRRVTSLPNRVDAQLFYPPHHLGLRQPLRILFVGQLIRRKRCLELLDAVTWLGRQGTAAHLSIVGDGPLKDEIKNRKRRLPAKTGLSLLGWVPRRDMPRIYRNHDILVHLSEAEGISNVLLEAMASGLCVIATRSGAGEIIRDGENGFLTDEVTPSRVGEALLRAVSDPDYITQVRRAARRLAEGLSWDQAAAIFEQLIQKLLGSLELVSKSAQRDQ